MGPGGKIRGSCGGKSKGEGKPKCLPAKKAYALGKKGRAHVLKNYNFKDFKLKWVEVIDRIHKEHGSWDTRKRESTWTLKEVA